MCECNLCWHRHAGSYPHTESADFLPHAHQLGHSCQREKLVPGLNRTIPACSSQICAWDQGYQAHCWAQPGRTSLDAGHLHGTDFEPCVQPRRDTDRDFNKVMRRGGVSLSKLYTCLR